mgnify:FL=1
MSLLREAFISMKTKITILASYAQEESRSVSENMKWRIKKNFEAGIPWNGRMLGYRLDGDHYEIVAEEAALVRRIFTEYRKTHLFAENHTSRKMHRNPHIRFWLQADAPHYNA